MIDDQSHTNSTLINGSSITTMASGMNANNWLKWSPLFYSLSYMLMIPYHIRITYTISRLTQRYRWLNDFMLDYAFKGEILPLLLNFSEFSAAKV